MTTAVPAWRAVISPFELTRSTRVLDEVYLRPVYRQLSGSTPASSWNVPPASMVKEPVLSVIAVGDSGSVTVSV